eukprot:Pgem_evm1s3191
MIQSHKQTLRTAAEIKTTSSSLLAYKTKLTNKKILHNNNHKIFNLERSGFFYNNINAITSKSSPPITTIKTRCFHNSNISQSQSKKEDPLTVKKWDDEFGRSAALPDFIEKWNRSKFYQVGFGMGMMSTGLIVAGAEGSGIGLGLLTAGYMYMGMQDIKQGGHAIRRNFPVLGRVRYLLESIRPEIRQYFIESDSEALPFSRDQRGIAYKRAKGAEDNMPMGTRANVYNEGYQWINHSMYPKHVEAKDQRVTIGGSDCLQPYSASILNVSAMSYGALSDNAVLALNGAARMGGFYHNTGE